MEELPEICRQVDAVGALAFGVLSYNTNTFLKLLALFTIGLLPLSVVTSILSVVNDGHWDQNRTKYANRPYPTLYLMNL